MLDSELAVAYAEGRLRRVVEGGRVAPVLHECNVRRREHHPQKHKEGGDDDEDEQENNIGIAKNDDGDMSSSDEEFEDGIDLEKQGKALEHQNVKFKSTKKAKVNDRNENDEENVDNLT